ncbi:Helix-turn-helix domain protein [Pseudovibrio sp. Ad5]|uniref:helix-turn-helix domain-containing protein n=1 Tax=Pseudovibrio sp. Ad5 TaxID=989436 RepID=UPI0007AE5367|nr:AraC family transcriptional regulator [Pseudovibrio sp. Ad5]KZK98931.1 Helix-turn-helix domain protein [Pseudovibrio sp. Ad5]
MEIYKKYPTSPKLFRYIKGYHVADQKVNDLTVQSPPTGYPLLGHIWKGIGTVDVAGETIPQMKPPVSHFSGQLYKTNACVHWKGHIGHILAEFTATGLYELFGIYGDTLVNRTVSVNETASEFAAVLQAKLNGVKDTEDYLICLQQALKWQAGKAISAPDFVVKAVRLIEEAYGDIKLKHLIEELNIPERTLTSRFKKIVGVSPKYFSRITQFNYIVSIILSGEELPLSHLAAEAGFYDQAHFTKTVQEFVLNAPSRFLEGDVSKVSSFIRQMNKNTP